MYSGNSLLRSPLGGLGKSDLNGEVTVLEGVLCTVEYNLGLSQVYIDTSVKTVGGKSKYTVKTGANNDKRTSAGDHNNSLECEMCGPQFRSSVPPGSFSSS